MGCGVRGCGLLGGGEGGGGGLFGGGGGAHLFDLEGLWVRFGCGYCSKATWRKRMREGWKAALFVGEQRNSRMLIVLSKGTMGILDRPRSRKNASIIT